MNHDNAMRPTRLADYRGQPALASRLRVILGAAKARGDAAIPHVLLYGPGGLGKSTLAYIIANEMGSKAHVAMGPALETREDVYTLLWELAPEGGDVLFIDEIHRLKGHVAEMLYTLMEDGTVYYSDPVHTGGKQMPVNLKPFTLIGATTAPELLDEPMRMRFGASLTLRFYSPGDLADIVRTNAGKLGVAIDPAALRLIAERSRGTPRVANHLLRFARDLASMEGAGITLDIARRSLELQEIDGLGLTDKDRGYLRCIRDIYGGGPVGAHAIAATLGCSPGTVSSILEPYMLQIGLVSRTHRGRKLTAKGLDHLKAYDAAQEAVELFAA